MLHADPLSVTALALFIVGLCGMLIRRSLLTALLCLNLSVLGASLLFCVFALRRRDAAGLRDALLMMASVSLLSSAGAAVAIAVFRRRATVHLDELRELRG